MSFYLSNPDVHPTGFEPAEFLDLPPMAEDLAGPFPGATPPDDGSEEAEVAAGCDDDRDRFGFVRVRLSGDPQATGYVSAYTVDGTHIRVRSADLLWGDDPDPARAGGA